MGHALSTALLFAGASACTPPDGAIRREPVRLVVEPAYFDDELPAEAEQPTVAPRRPASPPLPKIPSTLSKSGRQRCETIRPLAEASAERHGLDIGLVMAIARVESDFDASVKNRRTGATGLMQVMPSTGSGFKCGDLEDAGENMECGARVLRRYLDYFKGDVVYAVAAYHAGPKWAGRARQENLLPSNFSYVEKVMRLRTRFKRNGCE